MSHLCFWMSNWCALAAFFLVLVIMLYVFKVVMFALHDDIDEEWLEKILPIGYVVIVLFIEAAIFAAAAK